MYQPQQLQACINIHPRLGKTIPMHTENDSLKSREVSSARLPRSVGRYSISIFYRNEQDPGEAEFRGETRRRFAWRLEFQILVTYAYFSDWFRYVVFLYLDGIPQDESSGVFSRLYFHTSQPIMALQRSTRSRYIPSRRSTYLQ